MDLGYYVIKSKEVGYYGYKVSVFGNCKVVFVGDFVDRGLVSNKVFCLVMLMVKNG